MLGGLALKRAGRSARGRGQAADKPNLVMGINVQVCWEKFANYWDVEMRLVPMEGDRFTLSAEEASRSAATRTRSASSPISARPSTGVRAREGDLRRARRLPGGHGIDVPVHVDGASGAMIAPFVDPDLDWDFRLPRVASINTSGHKYGLVYPGVGWVVWRDADALPEDLIFWVNYLGDNMPTFALNFSRPGAQVVAQYYNFLRLGSTAIDESRAMHVTSRRSSPRGLRSSARSSSSPAATSCRCSLHAEGRHRQLHRLRRLERHAERGWQLPAYTFPENRTDLAALRVVVRRGFTHDMATCSCTTWMRQLLSAARAAGSRCTTRRRGAPSHTDVPLDGVLGSPVRLEGALYEPKHSLIDQSLHSTMGAETTNGDGFGVGWYGVGETPATYHSIEPAWNERNLRDLAAHVESGLVFAHIRASSGSPVQQTNCHPFRHGRWLWMHNGLIAEFHAVKRELVLAVDPSLYSSIEVRPTPRCSSTSR
jgi:glutamate decarboxylase